MKPTNCEWHDPWALKCLLTNPRYRAEGIGPESDAESRGPVPFCSFRPAFRGGYWLGGWAVRNG